MQARGAVFLAVCLGLCGCGPNVKDIAETGMDSSAPKFNTADCQTARQEAIRTANNAAKGDANAQAWMAQAYDNGTGVKKDPAQAAHWYELAAAQGNTDAEINLGAHYAAGNGVPKNDARAVELWQAAAQQRLPQAETNLGQFYADGRGVARDYGKAEQFYRAAATQGFGDAQLLLGAMYEKGSGVAPSDVIAYRWYVVAARNGAKTAETNRLQLLSRLSYTDKSIAERQAQHCLDTLYNECP
jgi:hypothetical protein